MAYSFNPFTKKMDKIGVLPQLSADPASPSAEDAWVLKETTGSSPIQPGLLILALSPNSNLSTSYKLKYRTKEGTTLSVALS